MCYYFTYRNVPEHVLRLSFLEEANLAILLLFTMLKLWTPIGMG